MIEFLSRIGRRPILTVEVVAASCFANVLVLASPLFVIQVLNRYVAYGVDATLATLTVGALIALALEFLFRNVRNRLVAGFSAQPDEAVSLGVVGILAATKIGALERVPQGLRREIAGAARRIEAAYAAPNLTAIFDVPFALLFIGAVYLIMPALALIVVGFVVLVLAFGFAMQAMLRAPARALVDAEGAEAALVGSAIHAADAIRAFNARGFLEGRWATNSAFAQRLRRRIAGNRGFVGSLNQSASVFMTIAVIGVGATMVVDGDLSVGAMIGVNILAARALGPISRFVMLGDALTHARQGKKLMRAFSRLPVEAREGTVLANYKGGIEFKNAAFAYSGDSAPLFENLTLRLPPGKVLLVNGGNGVGKTTLARLIIGLIEPTRGQALADGVDLRQLLPEWWRRQVVYMPQEPAFLTATIRENLMTNNPDLDVEGLNRVINAAGLRQFLDESTKGFETVLTDNGRHLSLGQRRRLALARALTSEGSLVIFDEPTEGLDREGCAAVYASLNELTEKGKTIIAISLDPNIVKVAQYVIDLGVKPVPRVMVVAVRKRAEAPSAAGAESRPTGLPGPKLEPGPTEAGRGKDELAKFEPAREHEGGAT